MAAEAAAQARAALSSLSPAPPPSPRGTARGVLRAARLPTTGTSRGPRRRSSGPRPLARSGPALQPCPPNRQRGATGPRAVLRAPPGTQRLPSLPRREAEGFNVSQEHPEVFFLFGPSGPFLRERADQRTNRTKKTHLVRKKASARWKATDENERKKRGQLLAVDHSARASMKNAASCEN